MHASSITCSTCWYGDAMLDICVQGNEGTHAVVTPSHAGALRLPAARLPTLALGAAHAAQHATPWRGPRHHPDAPRPRPALPPGRSAQPHLRAVILLQPPNASPRPPASAPPHHSPQRAPHLEPAQRAVLQDVALAVVDAQHVPQAHHHHGDGARHEGAPGELLPPPRGHLHGKKHAAHLPRATCTHAPRQRQVASLLSSRLAPISCTRERGATGLCCSGRPALSHGGGGGGGGGGGVPNPRTHRRFEGGGDAAGGAHGHQVAQLLVVRVDAPVRGNLHLLLHPLAARHAQRASASTRRAKHQRRRRCEADSNGVSAGPNRWTQEAFWQ